MEHVMYLMSADLREVHARLAKKFAGVAEQEMHSIRTGDNGGSNPSTSPREDDEQADVQSGAAA